MIFKIDEKKINEQEKHKWEKQITKKAGFMMEILRKMVVMRSRKMSFREELVEVRDLKSGALACRREHDF